MNNEDTTSYDIIFIGTSMISILEAIYQSLSGKKVLMIDDKDDVGGAWCSLELFGLTEVENAIHYFLPDKYSFEFMKKVLGWELISSPKKIRVVKLPLIGYLKMPYDQFLGRLVRKIYNVSFTGKPGERVVHFFKVIKEVVSEVSIPSYYVKNGTPEMLRKVKNILNKSDVELKLSSHIDEVKFTDGLVQVSFGVEKYFSQKINITHGTKLKKLIVSEGDFVLENKSHLRPQLHILVNDPSPAKIYECIFTDDSHIKYAHDISRFTNEAEKLKNHQKLFVFALTNDLKESQSAIETVFNKLKEVGIISSQATLADSCWTNVYLPSLYDEDLYSIQEAFGGQVEILRTEDFSKGIGYHAQRWTDKIYTFANS